MSFQCQKCPSELADVDGVAIDKLDGKAIKTHRRYICKSCGHVYLSADGSKFLHQLDFKLEKL